MTELDKLYHCLEALIKRHPQTITLGSSLSNEDQILTHYLCDILPSNKPDIFVLDTGRLHPETYDLMATTALRYNVQYRVIMPDTAQVESLVRQEGINLFYDSVTNRKRCCDVRKVQPLKRALSGYEAWITGLRRDQSPNRTDLSDQEIDPNTGMIKYSPLLDWSEAQVNHAIDTLKIPSNTLYKHGYRSIGCAPCTRAIAPDEPVRAGRWWWESPETKECGLHNKLMNRKQ